MQYPTIINTRINSLSPCSIMLVALIRVHFSIIPWAIPPLFYHGIIIFQAFIVFFGWWVIMLIEVGATCAWISVSLAISSLFHSLSDLVHSLAITCDMLWLARQMLDRHILPMCSRFQPCCGTLRYRSTWPIARASSTCVRWAWIWYTKSQRYGCHSTQRIHSWLQFASIAGRFFLIISRNSQWFMFWVVCASTTKPADQGPDLVQTEKCEPK